MSTDVPGTRLAHAGLVRYDHPSTVAELVAAAKASIELVDVDGLVRELDGGSAVVIDLRERDELERHGTIAGAIHAPRGMLEFFADGSSPYHLETFDRSDRRLILFCASGGRSALAAASLQRMGFSNVAHLEGGLQAWKAAGYPTAVVDLSA